MTSVNVYPVDWDASAFYRLTEPARALREQGADVQVCRTGTEHRDADALVFNRPIRAEQADVIETLVAAGKRVVVDIDDDFDHLPSTHQMFGRMSTEHLHRACKAAATVVVTTPALADVYGYGHAVVVPNYVPAWFLGIDYQDQILENSTPDRVLSVLWYGTVSSHPDDLQATDRGVARALAEFGARMRYIGPIEQADYVRWALKLRQQVLCDGWYTSKRRLFEAVATADVGIVPLADSTFNQAKSWLKGLEFAALGVPFVASPTPEYRRLYEAGAGLLARFPNDWYRKLSVVLRSAEGRTELSGKGREAATRLTVEGNSERFMDAWAGR